jgi:Mono-functional DNA-alkylating methyl methanesulfonate N-term
MAFQMSRSSSDFQLSQAGAQGGVGNNTESRQSPHITNVQKPRIGLFSQTIVPSPVIQFVLPARLRSMSQNDVVFIYERSLLIREIIMDTYLEDVMVNSEFDANILAAKAVKVNHEIPLDVQMKAGIQDNPLEENRQADVLPGHILVLTLDSRELVFLYHFSGFPESHGRFVHFCRALPSDVSISERFGRHLAVDPR